MKTSTAMIGADGYFASGLQSPGEIWGTALGGYGVGVSCNKVQKGMVEALLEVAEIGANVFVDSGAFAEVRFDKTAGRFVDRRPLADADWEKRLGIYEQLAGKLGRSLYLVAPDKVGDQTVTLERLVRYAPRVRAMLMLHDCDAWFGPRLIVPVQRGALSMADFAGQCLEALGLSETDDRLVWGVPSKKGATSIDELRAFAATCLPDAAFHFLGLGPQSPRFEAMVEAVLESCPDARITCDAVRISALSARDGKDGAARPLTAARDRLVKERPDLDATGRKRESCREVFGTESVALLHDNGWRDPELHDEDGTCYVGGDACPCPEHKKAPGHRRSDRGQPAPVGQLDLELQPT